MKMINPFDPSNINILVIGDIMLDKYLHGSVQRVSPEAPVPVVHVKDEVLRVGGAGNVSLNIAALGAKVSLMGLIGDDKEADSIQSLLSELGVKTNLRQVDEHKTIKKVRVISQSQQMIRLDFEEEFPASEAESLEVELVKKIPDADMMVISDYAKGTVHNAKSLIRSATAKNKPVLVDPKGTDFECYHGATIITPNLAEFEAVVGDCASNSEIEEKARKLIYEHNFSSVLITRGEHGMSLVSQDCKTLHLPAKAQEVFDVTGAGDTVISTLSVALASGLSLHDSVKLSNLAASIVVSKLGTSTINLKELESFINV